jgi:hypothetical protein
MKEKSEAFSWSLEILGNAVVVNAVNFLVEWRIQ